MVGFQGGDGAVGGAAVSLGGEFKLWQVLVTASTTTPALDVNPTLVVLQLVLIPAPVVHKTGILADPLGLGGGFRLALLLVVALAVSAFLVDDESRKVVIIVTLTLTLGLMGGG